MTKEKKMSIAFEIYDAIDEYSMNQYSKNDIKQFLIEAIEGKDYSIEVEPAKIETKSVTAAPQFIYFVYTIGKNGSALTADGFFDSFEKAKKQILTSLDALLKDAESGVDEGMISADIIFEQIKEVEELTFEEYEDNNFFFKTTLPADSDGFVLNYAFGSNALNQQIPNWDLD